MTLNGDNALCSMLILKRDSASEARYLVCGSSGTMPVIVQTARGLHEQWLCPRHRMLVLAQPACVEFPS